MIENTTICTLRSATQLRLKQIFRGVLMGAALMGTAIASQAAGPAPINLGTTASFAILSGAAVTTTGGGIINGNVGASPISGSAIHLMAAQVNGIIYTVDAAGPAGSVMDPSRLTTAKGDLTTAFNEARDKTPVPAGPFLNPGAGNIGGLNLVPGLYKFTGTAMITGSDVTLTGGPDDVWIFQVAADLLVGSNVHVILAGGARAKNIFWQVTTSASIGTFAVFKGTILADQAITMDTSSTMEGRALAFTAGVTFNGDGGSLPASGPLFTDISRASSGAVTVVLSTAPQTLLTLQTSTTMAPGSWTTVTTATPTASPWTYIHNALDASGPHRFYRAFNN